MIDWAKGRVVQCKQLENRPVQELRVALEGAAAEMSLAYHYTDVLPPVKVGDRVMLNRTAVKLKLGTGGIDFVCALLNDGDSRDDGMIGLNDNDGDGSQAGRSAGKMMKLRYTPVQRAVHAVEEDGGGHHAKFRGKLSLEGMPVLIGGLHSMLPVALCWLRFRIGQSDGGKGTSVAYVMTDGGALPLAVSQHAAALRGLGWLCGTVTAGHAYGGDLEAMNKYSALLAARHSLHAGIAIACMGPGSAGTGTRLGHTAIEVAELVHAVSALGGIPIVMPRLSFADPRERHYGLSHHIVSALSDIALTPAIVPLPASLEQARRVFVERQLERSGCGAKHQCIWVDGVSVAETVRAMKPYPHSITTMGRGLRDDPSYFLGVCAAAEHAFRLLPSQADGVPAAPSAEHGDPLPG